MGSEMCIRDRLESVLRLTPSDFGDAELVKVQARQVQSRALVDTFRRPSISRSRSPCLAGIADLDPVVKNRSNPLCRNPLIAKPLV